MSRYMFAGTQPRYRITVGVDRPLATFFAQVAESKQGREEQNDSHAEKVLVWVGCSRHEIRTIQQLAQIVVPYGQLPLPLQLQLVRDLDEIEPLPLMVLGAQLAVICKQAPSATSRARGNSSRPSGEMPRQQETTLSLYLSRSV